ncbi:MAG: 50S ribosomal protein L3 [bacterium]|nr:50S ribosomal protein L3 [bacterium]
MSKVLLGKKGTMSQIWKGEKVIPITLIQALPNTVSLVRTKGKDGYEALQLALGKKRREFRVSAPVEKTGDALDVSVFAEGDLVKVSGLTKGRGFQGGVKRHGFRGGNKTHGNKRSHRAPGSIGSTAPQRVVPGRRMAGHMGTERVTIKNLEVVGVDKEKNILMLKGAVPGFRGAIIEIRG